MILSKIINTLLIIGIAINSQLYGQSLQGILPGHAGQSITVSGYNYYNKIVLAESTIDSSGNFQLQSNTDYNGLGLLKTSDQYSLSLLLSQDSISFNGDRLSDLEHFNSNKRDNQDYWDFSKEQVYREQAYSALWYLRKLYQKQDSQLHSQTHLISAVNNELLRLEDAYDEALKKMPSNSYLAWYIPLKKLVNDMPAALNQYLEHRERLIGQFRAIDFNHPNFKTCGLFANLINSHFTILNSLKHLEPDQIYTEMFKSIDHLIESLGSNAEALNSMASGLFLHLEQSALYPAAAYLSHNILDNDAVQSTLDDDVALLLAKYSKLKIGKTAPDIQLNHTTKLSDSNTPVLLVFGSSWCPHCQESDKKLLEYYKTWEPKNALDVVYVSIDMEKKEFENAYRDAPWKTYCDFKGWETKAVKDYYVTGTPSYFLLDKNLSLLALPQDLEEVNEWIKKKGNQAKI